MLQAATQSGLDNRAVTQQLKACGLKPTMARLTVWQLLQAANKPLSMQDMQRMVFEQNVGTPFNTLYMALRQMEEKGLVRRLRVDGETRAQYVLAEREEEFSQSLICSENGSQQWLNDAKVRAAIENLCRKRGLRLTHYQLNVHASLERAGVSMAPRLKDRPTAAPNAS